MALKERLLYLEEPHVASHGFMAMIAELDRDEIVMADIVAEYGLNAADETTVDELLDSRRDHGVGREQEQLHEFLLLAAVNSMSGAYRNVQRFCTRFNLS